MLENKNLGSFTLNAIRFVINLLVRYMLAAVAVYACWIPIQHYHYWFSWHVILCTLGMIPLMTEALMLFPPDELWSRQIKRKQKYIIHGILMGLGTILVSAGCIVTFYYTPKDLHVISVHTVTGLISMILFILSVPFGYIASKTDYKMFSFARPVTHKLNHNFIGSASYIIGVISLCYSYYTNWFMYYTTPESRLVALIATILGTLWTMNGAVISLYNQIRSYLN